MDLPDDLGHSIVASAPDEHVPIAVASDDVAIAGVGKAGHILE
mgnify:CR=1 FL=1